MDRYSSPDPEHPFPKPMPTLLLQTNNAELTRRTFPQYEIGRGTYHVPNELHVVDYQQGSTLKIGAYCSLAFGVTIVLGGNHRTDWVTTFPFSTLWREASHLPRSATTKGDVVIGNDVWIGLKATIHSGVTIGDGAVIAGQSVIVKDVAPYTIVGGNPAREIRKRFDEATINRLQKIQWWSWPEEKIEAMLPLMLSGNIKVFLDAAERSLEKQQ